MSPLVYVIIVNYICICYYLQAAKTIKIKEIEMVNLFCDLECFSSTEHLSQLYAGFGELKRRGLVKINIHKNETYKPAGPQYLAVKLNSKIRIFYDLEDHEIINQKHLEASDFYFKRGFEAENHPRISEKILPFGFNYPVIGERNFALRRFVWDGLKVRSLTDLYRLLMHKGLRRNIDKINNFEGYPQIDDDPKILFLARMWYPNQVEKEKLKEERLYINAMRIECIRKLKAEFKENFIGGIYPDDYTSEKFPDCVVNQQATYKANYLQTVKDSSICIATMGLRKSTGWKMAEYVAGAKAIVSEKLHYQPSGDFQNGKNYLEFNSAAECVDRVAELFYNREKRYEMKKANYRYYQEYLRPDIIVWNSIQTALISNSR